MKLLAVSLLGLISFSAFLSSAGTNNIYCETEGPYAKVVLVGQIVNQRQILLSAATKDDSHVTQYLNQPYGLKGFSNDGRFAIYLGGTANKSNSKLAFIVTKEAITTPGQGFRAIYKWSEVESDQNKKYEVYMTCLRK